MPATFRPLLAAAAFVAAFAACDDPYAIEAQYPVVSDTTMLYSINSAPIGAPTAYYLIGAPSRQAAVAANAGFGFDVAVSALADGSVRLITPMALAALIPDPESVPHPVGLQLLPGVGFDTLSLAPASGYTDSVLTVTPGQTVAVQSATPVACRGSYLGRNFHAKMVVDSVRGDPARVYLRVVTDPNCDFRSLKPGTIPTE
jgi:hypothetical protein